MKYPERVKGSCGSTGHCYNGAFLRRMYTAMHLRYYHLAKPRWDNTHLRDFVYVARYNAWLRQLESQRRNI